MAIFSERRGLNAIAVFCVIVKWMAPKGAYRNFWAFFDPLPPSERKMTSLLIYTMKSLLLILTAFCQPPLPPRLRSSLKYPPLGRGNPPFCGKLSNFKICTKFESGQGIGQPNGVATGLGLTIPKEKLRLAYTMEFYIKIIYPLIFIIFNISYWSYYLLYASS